MNKTHTTTLPDAAGVDVVLEFLNLWSKTEAFHQPDEAALPKVRTLFEERLQDAVFRERWRVALATIQAADFFHARTASGWRPNVYWFLQPKTLEKALLGVYTRQKDEPRKVRAKPRALTVLSERERRYGEDEGYRRAVDAKDPEGRWKQDLARLRAEHGDE